MMFLEIVNNNRIETPKEVLIELITNYLYQTKWM